MLSSTPSQLTLFGINIKQLGVHHQAKINLLGIFILSGPSILGKPPHSGYGWISFTLSEILPS